MRASTSPTAEIEAGRWSRPAFWTVLCVALLVRVAWTLTVDTMPVTDFWWYYQRAVGISEGRGYSVDGAATAYWPVGYSAFLSAFFFVIKPSIALAKLLNLLLVTASVGLSFRLAHRLFRSNAVAVVSSLLLCFHLNWVAYSSILASEPLYTALTLAGTWYLLTSEGDKGGWTRGGAFFGLAVLVRPHAVLVPAIVHWCVLRYDGFVYRHYRLSGALWATYAMLALVLVPWTVRNVLVLDAPIVVSTNMGDNMLIGNNPTATGGYMDPTRLGVDVRGLDEVERSAKTSSAALEHVARHPWRTVKRWPDKVWNTFGRATDGPYWAFQLTEGVLTVPGQGEDKPLHLASKSYAATYHGLLMIAFLVAVPVLFVLRRRMEEAMHVPVLGLALIVYTALVSCVFFGNPRFAFPVMPYVAMYAGALLVMVWNSLAPRGRNEQSSAA